MVPLDKALASSYRLSIVTTSLSAAVWQPNFGCNLQCKVFAGTIFTEAASCLFTDAGSSSISNIK